MSKNFYKYFQDFREFIGFSKNVSTRTIVCDNVFGTLLGCQLIKYLVQYHKVRLQSYGYDDMKALASIGLSISTVYTQKKPKYFFRASAKVKFNHKVRV